MYGEEVVVDRRRNPKPVDEDLYRISPHLLHSIKSNNRSRTRRSMNKKKKKKKKKKKGLWRRLFTSCLVPCAS
ncbi:hypothetical protein MLD38_031681 [Melastoma candidum]|nr:hypothetical protein MLD38_031681 [Melastoma candidum]